VWLTPDDTEGSRRETETGFTHQRCSKGLAEAIYRYPGKITFDSKKQAQLTSSWL
jgi:hypothetical protein